MRKPEIKLHNYLIYAITSNNRFNCIAYNKSSKKEAYEWFKEEYLPALFLLASDRANVVVANIIEL